MWAAGVLGQAAWVLARYLVLRKKLARGRSADLRGLQPLFDRAAGGRRTPVVYSAAVSSPLVFGFLHPKIALPAAMEGRCEGVECILLHELTHVRRVRDMEAACDERVLELLAPARRVEYAQTLLNWAEGRRHEGQYAKFGQSDTKSRIVHALNWKQLPRWAQRALAVVVCGVFACTMTNPVLGEGHYLPVSSPFVGEGQQKVFRAAAARLVEALETGDAAQLAQLASMDPAYYEPVYAPFAGVRLRVKNARFYYNSKNAAEVYLTVEVQQGGGIYSEGEGTLVACLSQTDYRAEPFVSCLMPQKKYEAIRLLEDENEAVRLAVRLAENLSEAQAGAGFEAEELSPVVVARVCMESAVEDKGQKPPFTREEMALLAEEYFAIDGFFCDDPAVYDADAGVYVYAPARGQTCCPVEFSQSAQGQTTVSVESYRDPMGVFPSTRLQCQLARSN